ncbi:NAD-dependent epimerase/dehydratase family protein [Candidatus Nitrosotenuis aquarius]|uniref:NAD-dependent epimerase/dehydratase family protein n=1 Tax=Candidatus Nitrosotenuis aquarius TaxID=1846278 RepID=UPI001C445BD2|nr:NAD-dependent epimerase/dehydratase family protein [Candidatus Nitrosotenuis aquarius]
MKVLILGSEGFVGNNLVQDLGKSYDVTAADQIDSTRNQNYVKFNITDYKSVQNTVKDVDVVIDLVAHSLVSSIDQTIQNAQVNIIGLLNVLEACRQNKVKKIIFTSASSLVGEPQTYKVSETHVTKPKTAYGITKLTSEHYLRLYYELYGLPFVVFRFFNIYGDYQKNGLIPSLYGKITKNEPLTVFGKGDQIRDYVYIKDIVPFFDYAVSQNNADNSVFNLGTGVGSTILDVINTISRILQVSPNIEFQPSRPGEIGNFVSDTTLLQKTFGKTPSTSLEDGLNKTISWLKNNHR